MLQHRPVDPTPRKQHWSPRDPEVCRGEQWACQLGMRGRPFTSLAAVPSGSPSVSHELLLWKSPAGEGHCLSGEPWGPGGGSRAADLIK